MKTKILILIATTLAIFMKANAQSTCPTCSTTALPTSINTDLDFSDNLFCSSNDITINSNTTSFKSCNVQMGEGKKITVKNGATLNIIASHFYSCTAMWQGIVVEQGGIVNIYNILEACSLIEDARVAVKMDYIDYGISDTYGSVPFLTIYGAVFNRNEIGVQINGNGDVFTDVANFSGYFSIANCVFTSRVITDDYSGSFGNALVMNYILNNSLSVSYANTVHSYVRPYINNSTYPDNVTAAFLKLPFTAGTAKPKKGIDLDRMHFGDDGVTIGATSAGAYSSNIVLFDNHDIGVNSYRSQFTLHNCTFQHPNIDATSSPNQSIHGYGVWARELNYGVVREMKIETVGSSPQNAFYDMGIAILAQRVTNILISNCYIISSHTISNNIYGSPTFQNGNAGIIVNTESTNQIQILNNDIYNINQAIALGESDNYEGPKEIMLIQINNNNISKTDAAIPSLLQLTDPFLYNAIIVSSSVVRSFTEFGRYIECNNNIITKAWNGIFMSNFISTLSYINTNNIILEKDPTTNDPEYYGIHIEGGQPVGQNQVLNNSVTADCDDCGQIGIDAILQDNTYFGCNDVAICQHGIRFTGNNTLTRFWNNQMQETNKFGMSMVQAVIGTQGYPASRSSGGCMSDNIWPGANSTWSGLGHYKTYNDLSDLLLSKLVIQNATDYNPDGSGFATFTLPPYQHTSSSTTNTLIYSTNDPFGDCDRCGGLGARSTNNQDNDKTVDESLEAIANASIKVPADDANDRKYVMQQQLYKLLQTKPNLVSKSPILQGFMQSNQNKGLGFINQISKYIAKSNWAKADSMLVSFPQKKGELDDNYHQYFRWIVAMNNTPGFKPNKNDVLALANKCPLKSGNVVFAARNLYNNITGSWHRFTNNCNSGIAKQRMAKATIATSYSLLAINVYPNPTNGLVNISLPESIGNWQLSVTDIYGKTITTKQVAQAATTTQLNIGGSKGLYFLNIYNCNTGKQTISKILVQ
jgi:hypothetical protein